MIKLPESIIIERAFPSGNVVYRFFGKNDIEIDNSAVEIFSTEPFIIVCEKGNILFTSKADDAIPEDCAYAILTSHKPRKSDFRKGDILCRRWLKHPHLEIDTPEDITQSWRGKFLYTKEDIDAGVKGLRAPQIGALYSYLSYAQEPKNRGIIVMPTGTGKTETMLSILIANQCKKVLVAVPYDPLREQIGRKFITLGVLPTLNIVSTDIKHPYVSIIRKGISDYSEWKDIITRSNVVVTTMNLLASTTDDVKRLISNEFSQVFIDEAHHSEAQSWSDFIDLLDCKKVTMFTATPFRNDGKKLQGDYLYSFSLKSAQEQGYYKTIDYLPVREYNKKKADKVIAEKAVHRLREDIANGFNHILMARCATKARAEEVFQYYAQYEDLSPVMIHSQVDKKQDIVSEIKNCEHRIIVCVNMLGEGFDLPQMKIAAVHDERQSLPITLQFIGRFTRTSFDDNLGNASLIVNIANPPMADALRDLYAKDSDWNILLPQISDEATQEEIDFGKMLEDFHHLNESKIPFREITPALSAIIYRIPQNEWRPDKWKEAFNEKEYDYVFGDCNGKDTLVITLGRVENVGWGKFEDIQNLTWDVVILYFYSTPHYNHAYINTSLDSLDYNKFVEAIFGENCERITGETLFRTFSGVSRLAVMNFGGRKGRSGDISFKSYYGKDVQEGITKTSQGQLTKNNIFGNGFRDGQKTSIGCSIKGKVWSYMRGNLKQYTTWCQKIGKLIEDSSIDPNIVLQNTLKVEKISSLPRVYPISIDWDPEIYVYPESSYTLIIEGKEYPFYDIDLNLSFSKELNEQLFFEIKTDQSTTRFKITYFVKGEGESSQFAYEVSKISGPNIEFICRSKRFPDICEFFNDTNNAPIISFADGSQLFANNYVCLNSDTKPIDPEKLIAIDWRGLNLANESQHVIPYVTDSIQYFFSQRIINDFDVLFDDDGSGEIADLVGLKDDGNVIHVHLYHLKYAQGGRVSNSITNFYEVCGQAQKSLKWKDHDRDLFHHMLARETKSYGGRTCSRILHGDKEMIERFADAVNWKKSVKFHINIVQPALSKASASEDILRLLGSTADFIKDTGNVDLNIYCSE